jgi:hypothetical protein
MFRYPTFLCCLIPIKLDVEHVFFVNTMNNKYKLSVKNALFLLKTASLLIISNTNNVQHTIMRARLSEPYKRSRQGVM